MNRRMIGIVVVALLLVWAAAAALVRADNGGDQAYVASQAPQDEPTIPPEPTATSTATPIPMQVEVTLTGGPARFCSGWNLYYTFRLTNTHPTDALTNLVVTDAVPLGTWYAPGGITGTISGTFDAENNLLTWQAPSVEAGEAVEARLTLHSYSGLAPGTIITNTFVYAGDQLEEPGQVELGLAADPSICPTATPTPTRTSTPTRTATATETATATPTRTASPTLKPGMFLPLIAN